MTWKRIALLAVGVVAILAVSFVGIQSVRAWWAWRGIERVEFDTDDARDRLLTSTDVNTEEYDTVLAIGNDFSLDDPDRQEGVYADAVLFWLSPTNGSDPILVSLPRDLLVVDPCTGEETKLDRTLAPCGDDVSGPEHVALAVEGFTGIGVDHFVMFGFDAFTDVIDAVGGIEICLEYAMREATWDTAILPAGCSVAEGARALAWVRSRNTQEFVDGEWVIVEGVSDRTRAMRQQTLMFALLAELKNMRSPTTLTEIAGSLGDTVILDEGLSMSDAVSMVWNLRNVPASSIRRIVVPTEPVVTGDGSFALRATVSFRELLEG